MSPACSPVCPGISRVTICTLLLSGLCSCLRNYYFIDEPKTWHEAQSYCREKYGDLASIRNHADVARLIQAVGSGHQGEVWFGLHNHPQSWRWILTDPDMYEEGEGNYRRWNTGEPNDVRGRATVCVVMKDRWFDTSCGTPYAFVCYNNTDELDPSAKRHFFITEKRNWGGALAYCREHYSDLTSVRNHEEHTLIKTLTGTEMALIGLYRHSWVWWSGGGHSTFENWVDGHPRNLIDNCAATVFNATNLGKWVANHCAKKIQFVCQNTKKRVFNIKVEALKSTIDLNDPSVTETALSLIERKLNETGIGKHFKVSWIKKPGSSIFHREEKKTDVVT